MKSGTICAFEVTATWDPKKKQSKSISKYLGVVLEDGSIAPKGSQKRGRPRKELPSPQERLIKDFGDAFLVNHAIESSSALEALKPLFEQAPELRALMTYRLCYKGAMVHCEAWLRSSALSSLYTFPSLSSQRISRFLVFLGDETLQRAFFKTYAPFGGSSNVIIDATSLPSQMKLDLNAWGYNEGGISEQIRFHCVVDQIKKRPLFYRTVPGNISDISSLEATLQELKELGIQNSFALLDAGYCSEENIGHLRRLDIAFLMRLPSHRKIFKEMIERHQFKLESPNNCIKINKRTLFVSIHETLLYGQKGFVYMILDPAKKVKDLEKWMEKELSGDDSAEEAYAFKKAGIFMLISSKAILTEDILSAYYTRQSIEQIFGFEKEELDLLPLRCHTEETLRGYLFLQFLLLIIFIELREKLKGDFTVEQALLCTRALKCKVYDDKLIVQELTKDQKQIFLLTKTIVPSLITGI